MTPAIDDPRHDREAGSRDATLDTTRIDDVRIGAVRALVSPAVLLEDLPVTAAVEDVVERTRQAIGAVLQGRDDRLVVVVGPCSIHDHDAAIDYARRLKPLADALRRRADRGHARVLREAAHHGRLEGLHQRPAAGRQLPHQRRPAARAGAAAGRSTRWACPRAPSSSTC